MNKHIAFFACLFCLAAQAFGQTVLPYQNPALSTDQRVNDLVGRLNLGQKVRLLMYTSTPVDSAGLQVPAYNWWNECLHGVARAGKATVFPQAIGLAATFHQPLLHRVASTISDEARAKFNYFQSKGKRGIYRGLNFWTPNINIFRDPRWGRGMETYGEDPYLTGTLGTAFVQGLQGTDPRYYKAIATIKHFVTHSGPEETRHSIDVRIGNRDFYETYTPAFKMCVQQGKAYSLMCAYNRFRGEPCCGNDFLLNDLLRRQWGFNGFIVTDCWALNDFYTKGAHEVVPTPEAAAALAIKSGVDLECGPVFRSMDVAVAKGLITETELDGALKRLFTARFKLGLFDNQKQIGYNNIPYSVVESPAHKALALQTAQESIVLLKNEGNLLPLKPGLKTLAVIGPNADNPDVLLANYHGYPTSIVTPLQGLRKAMPNTRILYAKGSRHTQEYPSLEVVPSQFLFADAAGTQPGLQARYFKGGRTEGLTAISRQDARLDFYWIENLPAPDFDRENFSVQWSGYLKAPVTGKYTLALNGFDRHALRINDSSVGEVNAPHEPDLRYKSFSLVAGQLYKVEVRFQSANAAPFVQLMWERPDVDYLNQALQVARQAEAVVLVCGLSPKLEGEEMPLQVEGFNKGDRTLLGLPAVQSQLIRAVQALGKPVVLVLVNGSALAVNWEKDNLPAIVEAWYGGQEAGTALANVLTGKYNPAGRLPVTFYTSEKELPAFDDYNMAGRTYRYYKGQPLFEFGYGLSYTSFAYSGLKVPATYAGKTPLTVEVKVRNTGQRAGDEVVQLYLTNQTSGLPTPLRSLKGYQRVRLQKGAERTLRFTLNPEDFSEVMDNGERVINAARFQLSVGGGQPTPANAGRFVTTQIALRK